MTSRLLLVLLLALVATLLVAPAVAEDAADTAPTVAEQVAGLQTMCSEAAAAQAERRAKESLHSRLGGDEKIAKMFGNIVKRHRVNETIKMHMEGIDDELLVKHLVDFVSAGCGGGGTYTGRSMEDSHRYMKLTDADFLAAGGDVSNGMAEMGYGANEIEEFICILVSLKDQVVFE